MVLHHLEVGVVVLINVTLDRAYRVSYLFIPGKEEYEVLVAIADSKKTRHWTESIDN